MTGAVGPQRRVKRGVLAVALAASIAILGACSDDGGDSSADADRSTTTSQETTSTVDRPGGPAADLSEELSGGDGVFIGTATPDEVEKVGYVEKEYVAAGTAASYRPEGELGADGAWTLAADGEADYRTRVLVRTPEDEADFSGTVIVEWLNVSGGVDAEPEWSNLREEITRSGDAYVGVSAQRIGVEGGEVAVKVEVPGSEAAGDGLKKIDPERYGSLAHPGDGFAFDIYTQVARALRAGDALQGLEPERIIAAGQSQSAFAMVTYYNGVQPLTEAYDGFFVHSRGGAALPLVGPGEAVGIADSLGGTATKFRDDLPVPVMNIQTEGDIASILGSYAARQDDSDTFRLWEVAGTAHADVHTLGVSATYIDCGVPINDGPLHVVAKASYHALKTWMDRGEPPQSAPRIEVAEEGGTPTVQRDEDDIALGGVRTPPVDVPVATLSGEPGPDPSVICILLGSTKAFTAERLGQLYPSREEYEQMYDAATDATINAGYALDDDRDALVAFAAPDEITG